MDKIRISGFSMVKNATKLYYPIKAAIQSVLPIVDEFVVALGNCDEDDQTRDQILSIGSPKVRIIDTIWDLQKYPRGMENAHQTDIAKAACSGDWLLYLQADEIIHERYLDNIVKSCQTHLEDHRVEGLLFGYKHFWGDYQHYHKSHGWYPYEIRMVRNDADIHSWESAQSFRRIPNFDGFSYRQKEGSYKLNVALVDAEIYHYGWVRPPQLMRNKGKALATIHHGEVGAAKRYQTQPEEFDYGPLGILAKFEGSHPKMMHEWIDRFDWQHKLDYSSKIHTAKHKHQRLKYRLLTFIEQKLLAGRQLGGFQNYKLLKTK